MSLFAIPRALYTLSLDAFEAALFCLDHSGAAEKLWDEITGRVADAFTPPGHTHGIGVRMSPPSLPAGWTRSLVDWHRRDEPARFEADMAKLGEMAARVDRSPFRVLVAPMEPSVSLQFGLLSVCSRIESARLAADLEDVEERALVATRVFGAL